MAKQEVKQMRSISLALLKMTKKQKLDLVDGTNEVPQFVARIGGIVSAVSEFSDKKTGEVRQVYKGLFTFRTHADECFQSSTCFLPKQIERDIATVLKSGVTNPQFSYDIFIVENPKSATGYSWNAEPTMSDENRAKADKLIGELLSGEMPSSPKKLTKK